MNNKFWKHIKVLEEVLMLRVEISSDYAMNAKDNTCNEDVRPAWRKLINEEKEGL